MPTDGSLDCCKGLARPRPMRPKPRAYKGSKAAKKASRRRG